MEITYDALLVFQEVMHIASIQQMLLETLLESIK